MRTLVLKTSIVAMGLLGCSAEPPPVAHQPDVPPPVAAPQPHFDSAVLARGRQSVEDFLQANIVSSTGPMNALSGPEDVPQMAECVHNLNFNRARSMVAVARARVLDAQPIGVSGRPQPDSISVLAELLFVAQATLEDTVWNVESAVHTDSVRFTLVSRTERKNLWMLCWPGYEAPDAPGQPVFFNYTDSSDIGDVRWKPPLTSWASFKKLADSVRWSSLESLENDTAVTRIVSTGDFSNRLGVLEHTRENTKCLTIADSTLPAGTPLLVVSPDDPKSAARGAIEARRAHECMRPGDEWGSVAMAHASYYEVVFPPGDSVVTPGIVIAGRPAALHKANGVVSIDIDGDGHPESFESCTSREGTHLIVKTRNGQDTTQRWEAYIYVPYDLEPDCGK